MKTSGNIEFHPARNPVVRMNGVCPYFTMYPLPFPFAKLSGKAGARVLDPFCGRGTTNFAARLHGLASFGIDSNPVAAAVASAKLVSASASEVEEVCRFALLAGSRANVPQGEFWQLCYHAETLLQICAMRNFFLMRRDLTAAEIILKAVLLGILHGPVTKDLPTYLSNQMPRTYATKPGSAVRFWTKRRMKPQYVSVLGAVKHRAEYLLADLPPQSGGEIRLDDSRTSAAYEGLGDIDLIITSPPYLGMRTYLPDQWLRNWFLGGAAEVEYMRPEQITTQDDELFAADLAMVWKECATICRSAAGMVIRFGALPSYRTDPTDLVKRSLRSANCGWELLTVRRAGLASHGKRQAEQFSAKRSEAIEEIDAYCRLAA